MNLPKDDSVLESEEMIENFQSKSTFRSTGLRARKKKKLSVQWDAKKMTRCILGMSISIVVLLLIFINKYGNTPETHFTGIISKNATIATPLQTPFESKSGDEGETSLTSSVDETVEGDIVDATDEFEGDGVDDVVDESGNELASETIDAVLQDPGIESAESMSNETAEETLDEIAPNQEEDTQDSSPDIPVDKNEEIIAEWGKWGFWDGGEDIRPHEDYWSAYPNRDIPNDKLPQNAWQGDAVYVNHFVDAGLNLISRAQEAIYAEYGHSKAGLTPEELREREKMFNLEILNLETDSVEKVYNGGGWTTKDSFEGLSRRLLHAMITRDTFTVVMGGHSAAAGHGNHFKQSYMMSFHHFMEPIFDRFGVKLITRNLAHGGLGTLQSALGSGSIYGNEIDMLVWDSGMTEKEDRFLDLFYRQALLAGKRPPFLWNGNPNVLKMLHKEVGAHVAGLGTGLDGIPITMDNVQVLSLPWAAQRLVCDSQSQQLCTDPLEKFRTTCWIDRPDVDPPTKQDEFVGGRAGWHPGWRSHQLVGRVMAFTVLKALSEALNVWSMHTIGEGFPLDSEYWHMTEIYNEMQSKVRELNFDTSDPFCEEFVGLGELPRRVCTTPLKARTEFTPRAILENDLISIIKPTNDGYIPQKEKLLYTGPDVPIPELEVPENEIDIHAIVSNRRLKSDVVADDMNLNSVVEENEDRLHSSLRRRLDEDRIYPGAGWSLHESPAGNCDGTYDAICGREAGSNCLLSGHMDRRAGILGDSLSGWLVMNIEGLKEGLIMIKLETWHKGTENPATDGWEEVNNGADQRRKMESKDEQFCDDFQFQYAISGEITTLNRDEFVEKVTNPQRVVEILTIMDDEEMAKEDKERDIELAIRLTGCKKEEVALKLTHIYWA